jgi:hypothetical protein
MVNSTHNSKDKAIRRNAAKETRNTRKAMFKLLTECGGGSTPNVYCQNNPDDVIFKNKRENYPKEVSKWTQNDAPPLLVA